VTTKRVLFLCTGNSARSQMAEAVVNARFGDEWQAVSAGTEPAGYVHPMAVRALAEIGIDHRGRSKSAGEFHGEPFDLVVTVCDDAAKNCPFWPGLGRQVHFGLPDPAKVSGTEDESLNAFRAVRDQLATEMSALLHWEDGSVTEEEAALQRLSLASRH
jgi:arsenate reductase